MAMNLATRAERNKTFKRWSRPKSPNPGIVLRLIPAVLIAGFPFIPPGCRKQAL